MRLRARCARLLRRLAEWLDPAPTVAPEILEAARAAVLAADALPHSSAYKRAIAFKALMPQFRGVARRDLGLAIELAVREVVPK